MSTTGYALFETAIGTCAVAWGDGGIVGIQLPERNRDATRARFMRRFPDAVDAPPPPEVKTVIDDTVALLSGEAPDLASVRLDYGGLNDLDRRVYEIARRIPVGRTVTYGDIARELGDPSLARDVGKALGANPFPIVVPCHRVLGADGKVGGFSAAGGVETKIRMLSIEKAKRDDTPALFDDLPLAIKPPLHAR